MEFFIRQGASDPILKLRLIDDGKNDKSSFNDTLETAVITFDMFNTKTGEPVLLDEPCNITTRTKLYHQTTDEYYIAYRFTEQQTSQIGKFEGRVNVQFTDGLGTSLSKLILPIKEKLFINIS
jgi:hypothetical protein